jgi:hypothetical protein
MPMNPAAPVTRTLSPTFNSFAADQGQAFAQRIFELGRRSSCRMRVEMPRASDPLAMRGFVVSAPLDLGAGTTLRMTQSASLPKLENAM